MRLKHLKTALLLQLLRDPQMDMVLVFSRMKHGADRRRGNWRRRVCVVRHCIPRSFAEPTVAR
jgi:superfamily II DNA/RNA helicase